LFQKLGQPPETLHLEPRKHCKRRNSNLRPLQFLQVKRSLQGAWRDAYCGKWNFSSRVRSHILEVHTSPIMTPILAKVTAIEKRGDQYQVIVQISPKYRGSFNTLAFGEIKPHSGSLKDGRLDLVYHQNPGFNIGDPFPNWTLH
jgi:hypothetical protein